MAPAQLEPSSVFEGGLLHDAFVSGVRFSGRGSTLTLQFSWPWVVPVAESAKRVFAEQMRSFQVKVILSGVSRFSLVREQGYEKTGAQALTIEGFRLGAERLQVREVEYTEGATIQLAITATEPATRLEVVAAICSVVVDKSELLRQWLADPGVRVAPFEFLGELHR